MTKINTRKVKKALRKLFISLVALATILWVAGPFLIRPQIALAQDTNPPGMGHWPLQFIDGDATASTTVSIFAFAGDDQATPGGSPDLTVTAFYKNPGWTGWASSNCPSQYTDSNLFKCTLGVSPGADARTFQYYLRAHDGANAFFLSWGTDNTSTSTAQTYPVESTVYNTPSWTNTISGAYSSTAPWAGVKDGRCFILSQDAPAGTSTIHVSYTEELDVNDWIVVAGAEKFKILATTTDANNNLEITLSGYLANSYQAADHYCIDEFLAGATIWVEGMGISAISSDVSATSTYGTFTLSNVPDGCWDVVAFKKGYCDARQMGICLTGGQTFILDFFLPYGDCKEGGDMEEMFVIWSAPMDGMISAPTDISLSAFPIIIAFSKNASSTTVNSSNIELQKVNPDGTTTLVSGYSVAYEPMGQSVTIEGTTYDFGPDAQAILYSSTALATSTQYIVRIKSDVKDESGNSVSGNDPAGGHTIFFSTGSSFEEGFITSENFGIGGEFMPPFVMNVIPDFGKMNVPLNTKIAIEFDQPMDADSASQYIQLWKLDSNYNEVSQITAPASLSQKAKEMVILTPSSNLTANTRYKIKVLGGMKSSSGISLAPPGQETKVMFSSEFETGSSLDTSPPTIFGSNLERYKNSAGNIVGVPTSGILKISFSEPINPETLNTNTIYLRVKGSTTNITGWAEYELMEGKALFAPETALNATTTYVLTLTSGIKDFTTTGNVLATTTVEFTTRWPDTDRPKLEFFSADDFHLSLTFSEPMNATKVTNTNKWPSGKTKWETSVLNPQNYVLYVDDGPPPTANTAKYFGANTLAEVTGLTFTYDAVFNTLEIEGLKLMADPSGIKGGVRVWVNNVTDISGNEILDSNTKTPPNEFGDNSQGGPVFSSQDTFGMMGPGGGGMFGPPPEVGQFAITDFGGKDPAMMGMMPVGVWPMNTVGGATSIYMIDIPISSGKAIPAGGKIVIGPFPEESDVSGAKNADINAQFAHYDLNGPGPGKVVIDTTTAETSGGLNNDGVTVSGQIVTVNLGNVGTGAPDFIHLELDGIKNPITPSQGGYKINIQTQDASGRQLESFTSMPFFITPKGKYFIIGHTTSTTTGLNGIDIFGHSPSTGPLFVTTGNNAFGSSTDGEFKIEGLNSGEVMLMLEPVISVGANEYVSPMPEPIFLDNTTTANTPSEAMAGVTGCTSDTACYYYKKFTLTKISAAETPGLTVKIYGDFSASGIGSTDIDIFAGGPSGFRVKTVTLNQDYSSNPYSTTLYLPAVGDYHVGIGPALPKGPMGMAAPPMPENWMPPKPEDVSVSGSGGSWTWVEDSGTPDDGIIQFTIGVADKTISGHVYDPAGNAVSNAEVFAFSSTEFFGTGTHVKQDGSFTLNVKAGFYKVGAFLPGAPPSGEVGVEVKSDGRVYVDGVQTTDLILKVAKNIQTGYTISGTVYSDIDLKYPATDASVFAYRTDGPGHAETMTDSKGSYTLYVGPGTWKVGAYLPSHGDLEEKTVIVPPSKAGVKFAPDPDISYVTIRERVWEDKNNDGSYNPGEEIERAVVVVVSTSTDYLNSALTSEEGIYEVKVPANALYDIEVWSPDLGELPPQKNINVTGDIILTGAADVSTEHATTVEITFYDASGNATTVDKVLVQLDKMGAAGVSNDLYKEDVASAALKVSTSTEPYILDIEVVGVPKDLLTITPLDSNTALGTTTAGNFLFATTTVDGYEKIKVVLPEINYISGQVKDESGNPVANALIHIEQPGKDIEFDVEADSAGNYTIKVASSTTPYLIQADKAGYVDSSVTVYATTSQSLDLVVEAASYTISGILTVNDSPPTAVGADYCYVWAEKLGGGFVSTSGNCDPVTGQYTITVSNGNWEVSANVAGYAKSTQSTIAQVAGANLSGVNLNITTSLTLEKQETLGMTGNVGGSLINKDAGFEMNIPRATLSASDSSTYNVKEKEISSVPTFTPTADLVGDKAEEITAYKMSGSGGNVSTVAGLNGVAFVDKIFTKEELAAEGIDTIAEIEQTKMAAYDDTAQNWTNLPTTITYLDANEKPVIPQADLSNVDKVVFNGVTKHFSKIGVTNTVYDGLAPAAPENLQVESLEGKIKISWSAVTTNIDGTPATDIIGYNIYRSSSPSDIGSWTKVGSVPVGTTVYYDPAPVGTYYYRVTADTGLQSLFSLVSNGGNALGTASGGIISYLPPVAEEEVVEEKVAPEEIVEAEVPEEEVPEEEVPEEEVVEEEIEIPQVVFEKPIAEMTIAEIKAKITEILEVIAQLQKLIIKIEKAVYQGIPAGFSFERNLQYGETSDEVKYLQIILKAEIGPPIYPEDVPATGWFGPITKASIIAFQEKYAEDILAPWELTEGTGFVGKTTRAKLNELLGK